MKPWTEFEEDVKPHLPHVRAYCYYLTASKWESEDLLQETLLRAFKHYRDTGKLRHPRSLLNKIARNLHIDAHRRRRGIMVPIDEALLQPHYDPNYASVRGTLEWVTEHLSAREMEMLLLAEVFDYSYQDIAEEMNCSVPAVKMVLHRSKLTLRNRVRAQESGIKRKRAAKRKLSPPLPYAVDRWTTALMTGEL
ncbi:RNA polymerase sigma factor [Paenibacillus sp. OV219]|uniref:RNA polymerase sigma factor n=1 Tax=Paenibacillus sp. OV219 TaxID=1884377 RepID=UPI0008B251F4|nr:RNA polymerase sigma factor [Paenibacillus sp. OV219]SEO61470.1 RNA polymerase sigma-70 factor, ECF subfamily [Paenibacillus sp. OV219]